MYVMISSRPDIAYGIGLVRRFMSRTSREHCLRYLKSSITLRLIYTKDKQEDCKMIGYCESDFAVIVIREDL